MWNTAGMQTMLLLHEPEQAVENCWAKFNACEITSIELGVRRGSWWERVHYLSQPIPPPETNMLSPKQKEMLILCSTCARMISCSSALDACCVVWDRGNTAQNDLPCFWRSREHCAKQLHCVLCTYAQSSDSHIQLPLDLIQFKPATQVEIFSNPWVIRPLHTGPYTSGRMIIIPHLATTTLVVP